MGRFTSFLGVCLGGYLSGAKCDPGGFELQHQLERRQRHPNGRGLEDDFRFDDDHPRTNHFADHDQLCSNCCGLFPAEDSTRYSDHATAAGFNGARALFDRRDYVAGGPGHLYPWRRSLHGR